MLFKHRPTEKKTPNPEPASAPSSSHPSPTDDPEDGCHRSLGSLIEDGSRKARPKLDRYHAMLATMEREGGARSSNPDRSSESSGFHYTVGTGRTRNDAPEIEIRFSKCESTENGVQFEVQALQARSVEIALDCGDWKPEPMIADADAPGRWRVTKALPRGEYRYKFIVDGQWTNDPLNPLVKPNPFGGKDSIVRVSSGP